MAEIITEDQPRIKFRTVHTGTFTVQEQIANDLNKLAHIQSKLESFGLIPILNDGLVGGNCSIRFSDLNNDELYISRSGKPPNHTLNPNQDFMLLTSFDPSSWTATYKSPYQNGNSLQHHDIHKPSSDSPLHAAALLQKNTFGWAEQPKVAIHGHAFAQGEQLHSAAQAGFPISPEETMFSTPEDLDALCSLFIKYPYPENKCYIRKGHGFLLLTKDIEEAEDYIDKILLPLLHKEDHSVYHDRQ